MVKVADIVAKLVSESPFIIEALQEGLINVTALAKKICPDVQKILKKEIKVGAIIMAINRMPLGENSGQSARLETFFKNIHSINTRTNLLDYTYLNSPSLTEKQVQLLEGIRNVPRSFFTFSQGISETTIIISKNVEDLALEALKGEKVIDVRKDLSSITLMLPQNNRAISGVYYNILKKLAWHGINLVEVISTSNEFSLVLQTEDLDKAFRILSEIRG